MNKQYRKISGMENSTRYKSYLIADDGKLSLKDFLWTIKHKKHGLAITYLNTLFLDEDRYIKIPFPFKQQ